MSVTSRSQFTLGWTLALVASFAFLFAGTKTFGAFGFTTGMYIVMIAFGGMTNQDRLKVGGGVGFVTLVGSVLLAWWSFGTREQMDRFFSDDVRSILAADTFLRSYAEERGHYPNSLVKAIEQSGEERPFDLYRIESLSKQYRYRTDGQSYQLTLLGADKKQGGVGINRDVDLGNCHLAGGEPLPFRQFLFDAPASPGMGFSLIWSFIMAASLVGGSSSGKVNWRSAVVTSLAVGFVGFLLGGLMAGFHIASAQSSH